MRRAQEVLLVSLLLCFVASGQAPFYNLTTNGDGRVLYFTTSLRQKGTDLIHSPKIYRLDDMGLELVAYRAELPINFPPRYVISRPLVDQEGRISAIESSSNCSGRLCNSIQLHSTEFRDRDGST
jgi:hypothetical protein